MRIKPLTLSLWNIIIFCVIGQEEEEIVIRIIGGKEEARNLAAEMGFLYKGPVLGFDDTYLLAPSAYAYPNPRKRNLDLNKRLAEDNRILWAEPQFARSRQKRDFLQDLITDLSNRRKIHKPAKSNSRLFNDELWTQEWYLQDTRSTFDLPKLDLNVLSLYKNGITGKGVRISILDDGLEYTHDDLNMNYDPEISYDCNEEDYDPIPRYDTSKLNSHGTRCAGEVAMSANNGKCGVGIAYNAKIGGVKLLDGIVTDRIEGTALGYAYKLVDIYSASWGPNDDGKTVDGPGRLALESLERGIAQGRNGRGSIFVWASGNGGSKGDNCNCDGYLASPYTISIGSASQQGLFPWYGEECASTLAVTYSSGAYKDQMIATTDLHNECTIKHTGTSASAPLAAGIIALALEVNPNLTWRDVQHLIVYTSEVDPIADNPGWQKNAAGFWFNTRFGFGLMNALGLVRAAWNWTSVPERQSCTVTASKTLNETIRYGTPTVLTVSTTGCSGTPNEVAYLEHIEVTTSISYPIRGVLQIFLTSPSGSKVELLAPRKLDKSKKGFDNWAFMSVMSWGEQVQGDWILSILDKIGPEGNLGLLSQAMLTLHGTRELPTYMEKGPRNYNLRYNQVHNTVKKVFGISSDEYMNYE